jgi:hypothetical protein
MRKSPSAQNMAGKSQPASVTPPSAPEYLYNRRGRRLGKNPDFRRKTGNAAIAEQKYNDTTAQRVISSAMADIRGTSGDNYKRDELGYGAIVDQMRANSDPTRATDVIIPKREKVSPLTGKQNPGSANAEYLAAVAKLTPKSTRGEKQAVENLGMDAYAKAYPELYAKSQKDTYNPLMQSTFGYQTGEAPDQLRKIGITPDMDPAAAKDGDDVLAGLLPANQEESDAYKAGYDIGASQFLKSQLLDLGNKTVQDYAVKTKQSQIYDKVLTPETQAFTNENIMSHGINMPAPEGIWQYSEQTPFTMPLEEDADFGALISDPNALGGFLADNFKSAYR